MATYKQQKYLWAEIVPKVMIYKEYGKDEAYEWIKTEYLKAQHIKDIPNVEFEEKMKQIREDFSKKGIWINKPNEKLYQ